MSHHESNELDSDYTQMDERKDSQVMSDPKSASPHLTATPIEPNTITIGATGSPMQSTKEVVTDRRKNASAASPDAMKSSFGQKRVIAFSAGEFAADNLVVDEFLKARTIGDKLHSRIETITAGSNVAETDHPFTPSPHQVRLETYQKSKFGSNRIQSARYTLFTFLPLNLWSQLSPFIKPANFYFLIIAILQAIPSISTTNGRPSILVPLIFVLTVTAIKDAIEDYHRATSDRIKNDAIYLVFRREEYSSGSGVSPSAAAKHKLHGRWIHEFSKNLLVGDFIFIENNQRIPADVLLAASGIERGTHAFIDTKDLDGETNLKPKFVPQNLLGQPTQQQQQPQNSHQPQTQRKQSVSEKKVQPSVIAVEQKKEESVEQSQAHLVGYLTHLHGELEYDLPNGDMSEWHASLQVNTFNASTGNFAMPSSSSSNEPKSSVRQNMGLDALILADCLLRNTPWIVGLCVYTGDETKLRRNMTKQLRSSRIKETGVFRLTKKLFVFMASAQFLLCLTAGIACGILQSSVQHSAFYLQFTTSASLSGFLQVFTWFILAKDFVPISLYVSMELVQFWQALFIGLDKKMSVQVANPNKVAENSKNSGQDSKKQKHSKWHRGKKGDHSVDLASNELETIYAKAQTSRLNEELSQVSYIFSDKTGTLTQNSMNFKKCVIGSVTYGQQTTEAGAIRHAKLNGQDVTKALAQFEKQKEQLAVKRREANEVAFPHVEFDEKEKLLKALWENADPKSSSGSSSPSSRDKNHCAEIREYLLALALNNAVFPKVRSGTVSNQKPDLTSPDSSVVMSLDSSSPDERALAYFAQYAGFELFSRAGGLARVRVTDGSGKRSFLDFNDVALLDFSAKRKRMTVLVEALDEHGVASGKIKIYTKGADSFVYPLLVGASKAAPTASDDVDTLQTSGNGNSGPTNWASTYANLVEFGGESLRTLVIAAGEQSHEWWFGADGVGGMKETYERIQRSQGDKEKGHTDGSCSSSCSMCAIEERIEREANLLLIGATAIEDLLQDGVGGALKSLLEANIKVWMLTGDNVSTAINIAISCNLLEADYEEQGRLFKLDREQAESLDTLHIVLRNALDKIRYIRSDAPEANFGLAMHSDTWKLLFQDEEEEAQTVAVEKLSQKKQQRNKQLQQNILDMFFEVAANCRSVIACRLEPKEKAQIVEEMRRRTQKVCLAIGDGNNDIPMIKSGDIGVGIRGVEGTGAVASADYSISQFRFICRLLFAYGHLNYRRMSLLISYIFYKSSILVWCVYCLGAYSMYSGQSLFMDWSFQLYNIAYTALPILIVAVLDRDFDMDTLEKHPLIYDATRGMTYFNKSVIVRWLMWGLIDSLVCFFVPYYTFGETATQENGLNAGFAAQGLVVYTCVCMVVNLKLLFFVRSFTWLHVASFILSFGVYWAATFIFNASSFFSIGGLDYYRVFSFLVSYPRFWLTLLFCLGVSAVINLLYIAMWETMFPRSRVQIYYEAYILGKNLDDVDAAYRETDKLNPSRNSALQFSNGISIRGSAQHTPPPAAPLLHSHVSQSKGNQVSDVEQDHILTSVVAPLDSHSRIGTGNSGRITFRSPVTIHRPIGSGETKEVPSPAGTHFRIRASSDVDEQQRGVDIGAFLPSPILGAASAPALSIRELDKNKKILASRLPPRSEGSDAGMTTVSSSNLMSMSATHLIKQPSLPADVIRVVSTTSFIEFHTEIEDKESPYTGFAFNHTPIGRLRNINTFVPVHEAHSIPK